MPDDSLGGKYLSIVRHVIVGICVSSFEPKHVSRCFKCHADIDFICSGHRVTNFEKVISLAAPLRRAFVKSLKGGKV